MSGGFRFKQFAVEQERSAMKVGTDGVLLGAWAPLTPHHYSVLDIGAGTGLVALMVAQRSAAWGAEVVAVEIEEGSVADARANCAASPWADRLTVVEGAVQDYFPDHKFDHIVSNPPYFVNSLTSPDGGRTTARHTVTLTFDELARNAERLLSVEGVLSVVLPYEAAGDMTLAAVRCGLFLQRRMDVRSKSGGKMLRSLLCYGREAAATLREELTIHAVGGDYTEEYRSLTRDFYLKF